MITVSPTAPSTGNSSGCMIRPRTEALNRRSDEARSAHAWTSHSNSAMSSTTMPALNTTGVATRPMATSAPPSAPTAGHMLLLGRSCAAADVVVASLSMPLTLESRTQKLMAMRNSRAIETEMRPIAAVHAAAPS